MAQLAYTFYFTPNLASGSGMAWGGATFYFCLPTAGNNDTLYSGTGGPFTNGDSQISISGGAFTNTANLVTQVSGNLYSWTIAFAEYSTVTQAKPQAVVIIADQDGPAWSSIVLNILFAIPVGQFGASNAWSSGNPGPAPFFMFSASTSTTSAGFFVGSGTNGITILEQSVNSAGGSPVLGIFRIGSAQAGSSTTITFDTGASAVDGFYNGAQVILASGGGGGSNQASFVQSYVGATKVATIAPAWTTAPTGGTIFSIRAPGAPNPWSQAEGAQPAVGAIPNNATFGQILQYIKRRLLGKTTQTATLQTIYQDDSATVLTTMPCSSDGVTQVKGKSS